MTMLEEKRHHQLINGITGARSAMTRPTLSQLLGQNTDFWTDQKRYMDRPFGQSKGYDSIQVKITDGGQYEREFHKQDLSSFLQTIIRARKSTP
jgi:hypothetical protein